VIFLDWRDRWSRGTSEELCVSAAAAVVIERWRAMSNLVSYECETGDEDEEDD
jgi:hypothetical protein